MAKMRAIKLVLCGLGLAAHSALGADRAQDPGASQYGVGAAPEAAPSGDDTYRFDPAGGQEQAVGLDPAEGGWSWTWTLPAASWDTALLGVRVAASGPQPRVTLRAGETSVVQYLETGARGLRWLNVSSLRVRLAPGVRLELLGQDLTLEASAVLRTFSNRLDFERRVLILAPHPDDAEIAAFGLYSGAANATVVTVTSGNAGDANYQIHFGDDVAAQYLFKGYLRAVDSVTVPWQGGVPPERCYNLGYFDARLATMHAKPHEVFPELYGPNDDVAPYRRANISTLLPTGSRKNSWDNLVADLVTILKQVNPEIVVMPHPSLDSHADHEYVTVAAVEALEHWNKPATFLLYTNHSFGNLYPFGPAGSVVSLPPWNGPELAVSSVYSLSLDPGLQRRKLFALESMHDLRLAPVEQSTCSDPNAERRPDYPRVPEVDYFRRGPRSEEVFFVFDRGGVGEVVRSFLAREAGR